MRMEPYDSMTIKWNKYVVGLFRTEQRVVVKEIFQDELSHTYWLTYEFNDEQHAINVTI